MEDCESSTVKSDNFSSPCDDYTLSSAQQESVNSTVEENVAFEKEGNCNFESNQIDLNADFIVNLLARDSSDNVDRSKQEVEVIESVTENITSKPDVAKSLKEEEKSGTDCMVDILEQNKISDMSVCNTVNSLYEKSDIEIIKEVVIEDASPTSTHRKEPVKENSQNTFSKTAYRCDSDSWTDDEDPSTSDSSSDSDAFFQAMHEEKSKPKKLLPPVKTKGEIALDELPPIEDLTITINEGEMMCIGKIHAIVETLVVVHTLKDMKPLDLDSVLFLSHDQPLGRIFDVFGPVSEPFYSIRFNSIDQINERGVKVGADVFFAPEKSDITTYVFVEELQNQKGSDASWKHNNEPPEEFLDYSDDEKEKRAKGQRRAKNRNRQFSNCSDAVAKRPYLEGDSLPSNYIPPPRPAHFRRPNPFQSRIPPASPSPSMHSLMSPIRIPRSNPFQSPAPPPSPSPSVCSVMSSPIRIPHSYGPSAPHQPRRFVQNQNILYRPSSQMLLSPYQQPHIFGQVTVLNPLSPALRSPSPLPSPVMSSNIPTLIPASHFSPVTSQNYFNQRFPRSPSPASHVQQMRPDPWLSNRSPDSAGLPPSHPLSVQIPNMNSFQIHQIPHDRWN